MGFATLYPSCDTAFARRAKHPDAAKSCQSLLAKIFHFTEIRICGIDCSFRLAGRGDRKSSRVVSWVAVDAAALGTRWRGVGG